MKYEIYIKQAPLFAQTQTPVVCELESDKINCNDAMFPASIDVASRYNPNNVKMYVIGHEHGAICSVFASNDQDALDNACDAGLIDCLMSEEQNHDDETLTPLGNASELFDLTYAWIGQVDFNAARDIQLIVSIVRAHTGGDDYIQD